MKLPTFLFLCDVASCNKYTIGNLCWIAGNQLVHCCHQNMVQCFLTIMSSFPLRFNHYTPQVSLPPTQWQLLHSRKVTPPFPILHMDTYNIKLNIQSCKKIVNPIFLHKPLKNDNILAAFHLNALTMIHFCQRSSTKLEYSITNLLPSLVLEILVLIS